MSETPFIVLSAILFTIGCVGVLTRRNAIVVFMCVELMLNASNLALITFARVHGNLDGCVAAFFVMVVAAAAEVVVGFAIIMTIFRTCRSASVDDASLLGYLERHRVVTFRHLHCRRARPSSPTCPWWTRRRPTGCSRCCGWSSAARAGGGGAVSSAGADVYRRLGHLLGVATAAGLFVLSLVAFLGLLGWGAEDCASPSTSTPGSRPAVPGRGVAALRPALRRCSCC